MPSGLPMPTVRRDRAVAHEDGATIAPAFGPGDKFGAGESVPDALPSTQKLVFSQCPTRAR